VKCNLNHTLLVTEIFINISVNIKTVNLSFDTSIPATGGSMYTYPYVLFGLKPNFRSEEVKLPDGL